jgi:hypothetical protein
MNTLTPISGHTNNPLFFAKASRIEASEGDPDVINLNSCDNKAGYKF